MAGELVKVDPLFSYSLEQLNSLPHEWEFEIDRHELTGLSLSDGMARVRLLRALMGKLHDLGYSSAILDDMSRNVYVYRFKRRKALTEARIHPDAIDI